MIISVYINKTIIYLLIYCIFKVLLYTSITNFFSSFLPPLYLISISKLFSFVLYIFQYKINKKIQSIENDNNHINRERIRNEYQVINIPPNFNRLDNYIYQFRKNVINICLLICASMLEVVFYTSFNKIYEKDLIGNKRAFYYLINNRLCFLLVLVFIYLIFYKKFNKIHNILSLSLIFFSQIILYALNYKENDKHYKLLLYSFFINIIYSFQNFIEKEINENNNIGKISPMVIMGKEGTFELIIVIMLNIGVNSYFGINPFSGSVINISITVKFIFMMLCIILSEYVRIGTLKKYNPFYICFYEEIIYIFFSIYNYPHMELYYAFFHFVILISYSIFIEIIELNFCGLNHSTQRYIRERDDGLNEILQGIANISSISTGSHSDNSNNINDDLVFNEDIFNFEVNNNETKIIFGKMENSEDLIEDKNKYNLEDKNKNIHNINIGEILDEDKDSCDGEEKNVFSNHLLK